MDTIMLKPSESVQSLVKKAHALNEPIAVYDGDDECLIAMSPAVFERLLFDTHLLNCEDRESLHL